MNRPAIFTVGEYELDKENYYANFAFDFVELGYGAKGYKSPNASVKPQNPNHAVKPSGGAKSPIRPTETGIVHVPGKGKTYVESGGRGVRKGHIRNIGGKAVMVGQSIIKAGKNTAGSLMAAAKNNPKTAAGIAAGAAVAGVGGGYLATRKKRKRI